LTLVENKSIRFSRSLASIGLRLLILPAHSGIRTRLAGCARLGGCFVFLNAFFIAFFLFNTLSQDAGLRFPRIASHSTPQLPLHNSQMNGFVLANAAFASIVRLILLLAFTGAESPNLIGADLALSELT